MEVAVEAMEAAAGLHGSCDSRPHRVSCQGKAALLQGNLWQPSAGRHHDELSL